VIPLSVHTAADPAPPAAAATPSTPLVPRALLLRAREAAAACAVSLATWWRWDAAGRCPSAVRIGGTVRWRAEDLRDWIACGCPGRKEWETRRNANGRPRQAGR
jgi:predicted DNA-binding transcriptional regulator AlpA